MVGSTGGAKTFLASSSLLLWKKHCVSHIPSQPHLPPIKAEGVPLEFCGVQLNWCLPPTVTEPKIMVFKQSGFFFLILNELFCFLVQVHLLGGGTV